MDKYNTLKNEKNKRTKKSTKTKKTTKIGMTYSHSAPVSLGASILFL